MNYQLNSYVNRKEAETLKEMIFKRARERSQSMTDDLQADVMSVARESFVSNNNPFSQIASTTIEIEPKEEKVENSEAKTSAIHEFVEKTEEQAQTIGFPTKSLYAGAANQSRVIQEQTSARQIQNTMREAREGLTNKKSFMGALEFLNSQAAVSLLNKRSTGIDIVA